jgi:hypothetical protein
MMLAATERTAQILTADVARMREEPNPAVFAGRRATGQLGASLQNGVERDLILTNKRTSTLLLVPILAKRENLLDAYDEKARFSAMLRIVSFMSSSYLLDAKAPRGRTRIFFPLSPQNRPTSPPKRSTPESPSSRDPLPHPYLFAARAGLKRLLGKQKGQAPKPKPDGGATTHHFFFPSSG